MRNENHSALRILHSKKPLQTIIGTMVTSPPRKAAVLRKGAGALASLLVMAAIFVLARRPGAKPKPQDAPFDAASALVEACRDGDTEAYLDCFAEPLRSRLAAQAEQSGGRTAFGESLRGQVADLKSVVVVERETVAPGSMRLVVERVFPKFNERQWVRLRLSAGVWKIEELGPVRRFAPEIPYGTPAAPLVSGERASE